ncbi:MAG: hypothetical protein ABI760_25190 [Ferruginibacter sp.]
MSEIKYQPRETHESKQRGKLIALFYTMISFGIGIYIEEADVLFGPYVKDMLTDSDNKYSPNMAAIVNSLIVGAALFPIFWVVKKVIGKTHQNEFTATESGN